MAPKNAKRLESYNQLGPKQQAKYDQLVASQGKAAANKFLQNKSGGGGGKGAAGTNPAPTQAAVNSTMRTGVNQFAQQAMNQGPLNFNNAPAMPQSANFGSVQAPQQQGGGYGMQSQGGMGQMEKSGTRTQNIGERSGGGGGMQSQGGAAGTMPQVHLPNSYAHQNMFSQDRGRIEQDLYGRATKYLDQDKAQASEDFQQQLANRGIQFGSDQYNKAQDQFDRGWNSQYEDARSGAIAQAGGEQSRLFGMGQGQFGSEMQLRQQGVGEQAQTFGQGMQARQQGVNEASQLYNQPFQNMGSFMPSYTLQGQQQFQGDQSHLQRQHEQRLQQGQRFAPHAPNYSVQTTQMQLDAAARRDADQRQHELAMAAAGR